MGATDTAFIAKSEVFAAVAVLLRAISTGVTTGATFLLLHVYHFALTTGAGRTLRILWFSAWLGVGLQTLPARTVRILALLL